MCCAAVWLLEDRLKIPSHSCRGLRGTQPLRKQSYRSDFSPELTCVTQPAPTAGSSSKSKPDIPNLSRHSGLHKTNPKAKPRKKTVLLKTPREVWDLASPAPDLQVQWKLSYGNTRTLETAHKCRTGAGFSASVASWNNFSSCALHALPPIFCILFWIQNSPDLEVGRNINSSSFLSTLPHFTTKLHIFLPFSWLLACFST